MKKKEKRSYFLDVSVPARMDFIGGWTDLPPYYYDHQAAVFNSTLKLVPINTSENQFFGINVNIKDNINFSIVENNIPIRVTDNIIVSEIFEFIKLKNPDIKLSILNTISAGSGLGGSSLLIISILTAIYGFYKQIGNLSDTNVLKKLISDTLKVEENISKGGWQDQIGGLFPGIKLIETFPEKNDYFINYINNKLAVSNLERCSLVIDSNVKRRISLHSLMRKKILEKDKRTLSVLNRICINAREGYRLFMKNKLKDFCEVLNNSWDMITSIEKKGTIPEVEIIKNKIGSDLIGLKMAGAGGGGFILTIFKDPQARDYNISNLQNIFSNSTIYKPLFGGEGLVVRGLKKVIRINKFVKV